MYNNLIFIGGIHGVGKSTMCRKICESTGINYLSASEVIKWKQISATPENKEVKSVQETQDRLMLGLTKIIEPNNTYLLDGHYCLLGVSSEIVEVPFSTFREMNPVSLIVIIDDIIRIKENLEKRDGKEYNNERLSQMQEKEIKYANEVSIKLEKPVKIYRPNQEGEMLEYIKNSKWT